MSHSKQTVVFFLLGGTIKMYFNINHIRIIEDKASNYEAKAKKIRDIINHFFFITLCFVTISYHIITSS